MPRHKSLQIPSEPWRPYGTCTAVSRGTGWVAVAALAVAQFGCATPVEGIDAFAVRQGWGRELREGTEFRHVVFVNTAHDASDRLHVYLEGDGSPYLDRWTVAPDPTPRRPLMLHLMALDSAPSVYVGRPCYLGLARDPPCVPADWTVDRYSERVVASLASIIDELRRRSGCSAVELYGHSGGGTLAVLIAPRLPGVTRVVTLAANLDIEAWTSYRSYTPLLGSLNPVGLGPLPTGIAQLHLAGAEDDVVPAWIVERAAPQIGNGTVEVLPGVTHATGWERHWREVLDESSKGSIPQIRAVP